jgi:hypothetical protein
LTTSSKVDGDTAKVQVDASGSTDSGNWSLHNGCFKGPNASPDYVSFLSSADGCLPAAYTTYFGGAGATTDAISVVQEHGRWFVSPVHTALDVVDNYIQTVNRRGLYTLLNVPSEIPSDGTLTLGHPVVLSPSEPGLHVFTFHGTKGERLLGLADDGTKRSEPVVAVEVLTDNGQYLPDNMLYGYPVTLPADGDYRIVMRSFSAKDANVTVWDAADAPEAAKHPALGDQNGSCTTDINGVSSCFSSSSGVLGEGESASSSATSSPDSTTPCVTVAPQPGGEFACAEQPLG